MKSRHFLRYVLMGTGVAVLALSGCRQQSARGSSPYYVTSETVVADALPSVASPMPPAASTTVPANDANVPPPATTEAPAVASRPAPAAAPAALIISNAPVPVVPERLRVSQALSDVIDMAQSGVDEQVILTYVTNSPAAFLLGAEEIIYLKDLGVSSEIITSMMERDQSLKTVWGIQTPPSVASVPAGEETATTAAPTYVSPPQPASEPAAAAPVEATDEYFDAALSPYGTWVTIDGYGRVWRPTIVVRHPGWRPYSDGGRWVYTDFGWYWMSDYSWGSVVFHYGRWFNDPRWGWCWWPNRVWGPSWVSWRYDNDYCGWAPLPPNSLYTPGVGFSYFGSSVGASFGFHLGVGSWLFVPWARFCDPHPYRYHLSSARSVAIFNQTTIVNNYGSGNHTTVINRGISPDRVRERARTEVRTVSLRSEPASQGGIRSDRFENGGRTLVVERPALSRPARGAIAESVTPAARQFRSPRDVSENRTELNRENRPAAGAKTFEGISSGAARADRNLLVRDHEPHTSLQPAKPAPSVSQQSPATPATPATRPTPIFDKPVTVRPQPTRPQSVAPVPRSSAPTVIGGTPRSSGRDYSVWSTPGSQPQRNWNQPANRADGNPGTEGRLTPNGNPRPQINRTFTPPSRETPSDRWQSSPRTLSPRIEPRYTRPNYSSPRVVESRAFTPHPVNPPATFAPSAPSRPTFNPAPAAPARPAAPVPSEGRSARPGGR